MLALAVSLRYAHGMTTTTAPALRTARYHLTATIESADMTKALPALRYLDENALADARHAYRKACQPGDTVRTQVVFAGYHTDREAALANN